jgi:tetratricopeptide (TPR) repeat protein
LRAVALAVVALLAAGCASSARFLWQEYTSEGVAAVGMGDYALAERFFSRALTKANDLGARERGISLNALGELHRRQGRIDDAERLLTRALEVKEAGLGPDHPDVATSLTNLALLYAGAGRVGDALPLLERALTIQDRSLGARGPGLMRTVGALAEVYRALGREENAATFDVRLKVLREAAEK